MFLKRLKLFLTLVIISSTLGLFYTFYKNYKFDNSELDEKILRKINQKHQELIYLSKLHFGINKVIPIKISDKMNAKLYGMATINKHDKVVIYLNKKRFKENSNYMINDVMPHEYAHALLFAMKDFSQENGGHTLKWENTCKKLNGLKCNRFVNNQDIVIEKTKKLYNW